jgi:uncharacterized protein YraI
LPRCRASGTLDQTRRFRAEAGSERFQELDMKRTGILTSVALLTAAALAGVASAQTAATATTDLNVRAGPGPEYPVVGVIAANGSATINGCLEGSKWCTVTFDGGQGWAYSDYLAAQFGGNTVVLSQRTPEMAVPVTTYEPSGAEAGGTAGIVTGATGGAVAGALIGGPVGAVVGGVAGGAAGGITGGAAGAIVDPPEEVRTYVASNQVNPVYLEGEVVVGAGIPDTVQLQPIPDYQYNYVYVNGQPVLVDPGTRQIVYVMR